LVYLVIIDTATFGKGAKRTKSTPFNHFEVI
jgi:hypothetical protein